MLISKFDTQGIEKEIEEFEKENRIAIPAGYRKFLLQYNGGLTPKTRFKMSGVSSDIRGFYGLGTAQEHYHYDRFKKMGMLEDFLKDAVLPIASNCFGDDIVIGIGSTNSGEIFFKYHDKATKYIKLANSFTEFVEMCKSGKIGHVRTIEERRQALIANGMQKNITDSLVRAWQEEIDRFKDIHQIELVLTDTESAKNECGEQ